MSFNRRKDGGSSSVWGKARCLAASRVPSISKTIQVFPVRSTNPPVCLSCVSGRASRSSRKSVRRASTGSSVSAAKKRESVERAGIWSRSNNAHVRNRKGLESLVELLQGALATDRVAEEHGEKID